LGWLPARWKYLHQAQRETTKKQQTMSEKGHICIVGTGHYVPERVVPNTFFEEHVETSDEWIRQRTGIRERRFAAEGEATSDLCIAAGRRALEAAGVAPEDLDLIIVGTVSPDQFLPAVAPQVQHSLGACDAMAFDVVAACTGFLTAMTCASTFLTAGKGQTALVIGAETLSRFLDLKDRTSCILFGDGAGAAVLKVGKAGDPGEILRTSLGSDGAGYDFIQMTGGGSRLPATHTTVEQREHYIRVKGRDVYRFAVTIMERTVAEMLEGYDREELGLVVPHQVNQRIIDAAIEKLEIQPEKVMVNIEKYGNTSAGSVPIALDEAVRGGRIQRGQLLVMVAFGAGLNWGGALVRW
jgi:3-oxoacyl-[acyl-carrier-protein] synthase-3